MLSTCHSILQQSPVLVCLLYVKTGKSRLWYLRYFHFRCFLACLHENSKWNPVVTGKCLRPLCILKKDISWPWRYRTLVQPEPSEHWNPRCREGAGELWKSGPPSHSASKGRSAGNGSFLPWGVSQAAHRSPAPSFSTLLEVFYLWICQKEKLCLFEVCV